MFNLLNKKNVGESITFTIADMHCTSCAMNIDGELEETDGVFSASTNYAKATSSIQYDPQKISVDDLKAIIKRVGYTVEVG